MPVHACPRCSKEFSSPYHLRRHMGRKNPCVSALAPKHSDVCLYCNRRFSTRGNMQAHIRNGTCAKKNGLGGAEIAAAISAYTDRSSHRTTNNTVNIITVNNGGPMADPTKLRDFGHEDVSHLTPQVIEQMLRSIPSYVVAEDAGAEWVRRVLSDIWANEDRPENYNVVQPRPRGAPMIVEGGKWRESSEDIVHGIMQSRAAALIARTPVHTPADREVKTCVAKSIATDEYRPLTRATVRNSQAELETRYRRLPKIGERWVPEVLVRRVSALPLPSTAAFMLAGAGE